MITNSTVTVYSTQKIDGITKLTNTHYPCASVHGAKSQDNGDNNITDTSKYVIRIPAVQGKVYNIKKGDYLVIGKAVVAVTLSELLKFYGESVYKITAVTDNRTASAFTSHIKLVVE
ncbi:MAG: DUF6751 family protein [Acutalibacteraceae bacterium]